MKSRVPYISSELEESIQKYLLNQKDEKEEFRKKMTVLYMKELMKDEAERILPDTFGCDCMFVTYFISDLMSEDFPFILNDFLKFEGNHLSEYVMNRYANSCFGMSDPKQAVEIKMLSIMLTAARKGSKYTICLFQNLYKTYYKSEYKLLKRFKTLSAEDLLTLSEDSDKKGPSLITMSRLLTIAPFFGIEIKQDCSFLYAMLGEHNKEMEKERFEETLCLEIPEGLFQECQEEIKKIAEESDKPLFFYDNLKKYRMAGRFMGKALRYFGYPDDYIDICNTEFMGMERDLSATLMLLKLCYPNRRFSIEEIQFFAAIFFVVASFCSVLDEFEDFIDRTLGLETGINEEEDCLFHPEAVVPAKESDKQKTETESSKPLAVSDAADYNREALLGEIKELRGRLHKKEQDYQHMTSLYMESKKCAAQAEELQKQYENEHEELIMLREHVYLSSEEAAAVPATDYESMTSTIAGKHIVIIGGHDNWTYKLKNRFSGWVFLSPKTSSSIDDHVLDHADYVYFFTDFIKHSTYSRFIRIVREKKIPFGYIHSINIQSNINQIYQDVK